MPTPLLLDLRDLGINRKGVGRVLAGLAPRLVELAPDRYHVACTAAALDHLGCLEPARVHVVPNAPQALWEQVGLPLVARRIGASAVYSHRECGAVWGPRLVLHLTEDPEIRWARDAPADRRDRVRRTYSRTFMGRSLRRSVVATSTDAIGDELARAHHLDRSRIATVPLAVDHGLFRPVPPVDAPPFFFHLGSGDPRDATGRLIEAYAAHVAASATSETRTRLVIGGGVGDAESSLRAQCRRLGIAPLVDFTGRLSDGDLVQRYSDALATVQPSSDEGFGLQPLEAAACGGLIVAARTPAVEEVMESAVVVWADQSVASLTRALDTAANHPELRERARVENPAHAAPFTWAASAGVVHELLVGSAP